MKKLLYDKMVTIMAKVQQSSSIHQNHLYKLIDLFKENNIDFYPCFEKMLTMLLLHDSKKDTIYVERCMNFFTSFCACTDVINFCIENSLELLHKKVLYFLLDLHNLENDIIRFRVCKIVSKLLTRLVDVDLDEEMFNNLKSNMLERLIDSQSAIRLQAIDCLYRLQDPNDDHCEVILAFLKRMDGDIITKVRKACVEKIAVVKDVIKSFLLRIRDANVNVRVAAFTRISKLVKYIRITQRHKVLMNGIFDESEQVRLFVKHQLIEAWLKEYDYNYLHFLKALRLDANGDDIKRSVVIVECVLDSLFETQSGEDILKAINFTNDSVITYEELNWESAIYWRFLVNTCRKSQRLEAFLENFLPDLVDLVKYIKGYCVLKAEDVTSLEFQFILKQLFMITCEYDLVDTSSRKALNQLINDVLCNYNLDEDVVEVIIQNMERSVPKDEQRERLLLEIISEITCPVDDKPVDDVIGRIMESKQRVTDLKSSQDSAIRDENYSLADQCDQEIKQILMEIDNLSQCMVDEKTLERKTDSETLLKCLKIARGHLRSKRFTCISSSFRSMSDEIIQMLTNNDEEVRCKAMECYALCCIVDKEMATKGVHVFYGSIITNIDNGNCDIDFLLILIKGIVDMLSVYGQDIISECSKATNEGSLVSFTNIIQLLVDLMDEENMEVQEHAGRGLCLLILNRRVFSPNLIARMILKWCNPCSDKGEGQVLRQTIGNTLGAIPTILDCGEQLDDVFFITLQTLLNAPNTSPLSQINVQDIIKFMLNLSSLCRWNMTPIHKNIAIKIVCHIKDNPDFPFNAVYAKTLLMLDCSSWDQLTHQELKTYCSNMAEFTTCRTVLNTISKFISQLNKFKNTPEE